MERKSTPSLATKKMFFYFALLTFILANSPVAFGQVIKPFTQRTSPLSNNKKIYNIKGDYTMIGNTNLSLVTYGDNTQNGNNAMQFVDVDNDVNTLNSSSATLGLSAENGAIPACSKIIYAGLYWTGRSSDSTTSPNTFSVTKSVPNGVPRSIDSVATIGHAATINYTPYTMTIARLGTNNQRYPTYTFIGAGGSTYVFSFLNASPYITYTVNGGAAVTPGGQVFTDSTGTGTFTRTVKFNPVTIYVGGGVTLTVDSLVRDARRGLAATGAGSYQTSSFARIRIVGSITTLVSITKNYNKQVVYLKGPTAGSYTTITANANDIYYPTTSEGFMYSAYAEVTAYVRQQGLGSYTLADMALREGDGGGTGYYGGWGLVVVYENEKMKWRDITIFDGHAYVIGGTAEHDLTVSGFKTVQTGNVGIKLGTIAGEGDRGISGDYFRIKRKIDGNFFGLNHAGNDTSNFFNSSVETGGNLRNPSLLNNTGLDINMFNLPNTNNSIIGNGDTTTTFRYGSTQDTYIICCIALSVDAYIPDVASLIANVNINGVPGVLPYTVLPGQDVEYNIQIRNLGTESVLNFKQVIPIPFASSFVPGSLIKNIYFAPPLPTPNIYYYDPLLGANGSIVWDFGTLPLPTNGPNELLADFSFKLKATTDCQILQNPTCVSSVLLNGTSSGTGSISGTSFNDKSLIQGYNTSGLCVGEPITGTVTVTIDGAAYVNANCSNVPLVRNFNVCLTKNIPVSYISSNFPVGSTFYNEFPVTANSIQYTASNPFPTSNGIVSYFAVPPGGGACRIEFTLTGNPLFLYVPRDTTIDCGRDTSVANTGGSATVGNSCNTITISHTDVTVAGTCPFIKTITRTWRLTDTTGSFIDSIQIIKVQDTSKPIFLYVPNDTTINCDRDTAVADTGGPAIASDDCNTPVVTHTDAKGPGNCPNNYIITRTWMATDSCGNFITRDQKITVQDTTKPVFSYVPADTTINCDRDTAVAATGGPATATDNCVGAVTISHTDLVTPGSCPNNYTIARTWRATDVCNNFITRVQTITVQDTTKPIFTYVPADTTINCDRDTAVASTGGPATATDNCVGAVTISHTDLVTPGSCPNNYTIARTWRATDVCNNFITRVQTITVQDTTKPVFTYVPADTTINCDRDTAVASTGGPATATDNCVGAVTISHTDLVTPGSCPNNYTIARTWRATDVCNNFITRVQTITVQDTTKPVFTYVPADTTINCDRDTAVAATGGPATATDNCVGAVTISHTDLVTPGSCPNNYTIARTWRATDVCNNFITRVQTITVQDTTKPVFTYVPADTTINCDRDTAVAATGGPATATDNCVGAVTISHTDLVTPGSCPNNYTIARTWRATDVCNNFITRVQTITVQDTTKPVISNVPADTAVACASEVPGASTNSVTTSDNCSGIVNVTVSDDTTAKICVNKFVITRTWKATDVCGNFSTASQIITVSDTIAPVWTSGPNSLNSSIPISEPGLITAAQALLPAGFDNCDRSINVVKIPGQFVPGVCPIAGTYTNTFTATDSCGNVSATFTQVLTITKTCTDTIVITPPCQTCPTDTICPTANDLPVTGTITYSQCPVTPASPVQGTLTPDTSGCIVWTPNGNQTDTIRTCVVACIGSVCDTTVIIILPPPPAPDTVYVTPPCQTCPTDTICPTGDDVPPTGTITYSQCPLTPASPVQGTLNTTASGCIVWTPNGNQTDTMQTCVVICVGGVCDTTVVFILPPPPAPDTVYVTPPCQTCPTDTICPTGDDVPPTGTITYSQCPLTPASPVQGTLNTTASGCIVWTPNGNQTDTMQTCVVICVGGVCDTTVVFILPPPPAPDTVYVTPPCQTCPTDTICPTGDDVPPTGTITYSQCPLTPASPVQGTLNTTASGCIVWTPNGNQTDTMQTCVVICVGGVCDTTVVFILPPPPAPDTVYVTPPCQTCPTDTICPTGDDVPPTGTITYSQCPLTPASPVQGTLNTTASGCIVWTPNGNQTDTMQTCVVICVGGVCDTTVVFILPPPPAPDTVYVTPPCQTCPTDTICPTGDDVPPTGTITYSQCPLTPASPVQGTLNTTASGCIVWTPNGNQTDTMQTCVVICVGGVCDTTVVFILPPPPAPDTVYVTPPCQTCPTDTICPTGDDVPPTGTITYSQCPLLPADTLQGSIFTTATGCIVWTPNGNQTDTVQTCVVICVGGVCDTTVVFILPPPPNDYSDLPAPTPIASAAVPGKSTNNIPDNYDAVNNPHITVWAGGGVSVEPMPQATDDYDDGLIIPAILNRAPINIFTVLLSANKPLTKVYYRLWIDWNNDGSFADDLDGDGFPATYAGSGVVTGMLPVPINTTRPAFVADHYRIRLVVSTDTIADVYRKFGANYVLTIGGSGEIEDYPPLAEILPVELLSFVATKSGADKANLHWITSAEQNSKNFILERSNNASLTGWSTLATIPAAGNSSTQRNYNFVDTKVLRGRNYYRLRMVDLNNSQKLSEIRLLNFDVKQTILAYPNPVKHTLFINGATIGSKIALYDASGKLLAVQNANGTGIDKINTESLSSGAYYLKVQTAENGITTIKLTK